MTWYVACRTMLCAVVSVHGTSIFTATPSHRFTYLKWSARVADVRSGWKQVARLQPRIRRWRQRQTTIDVTHGIVTAKIFLIALTTEAIVHQT